MCRFEMKDVHSLQSFFTTHSQVCFSSSVCSSKCFLTSAFFKENSAIWLEEWVLVFKLFTTATRRLRVDWCCERLWKSREYDAAMYRCHVLVWSLYGSENICQVTVLTFYKQNAGHTSVPRTYKCAQDIQACPGHTSVPILPYGMDRSLDQQCDPSLSTCLSASVFFLFVFLYLPEWLPGLVDSIATMEHHWLRNQEPFLFLWTGGGVSWLLHVPSTCNVLPRDRSAETVLVLLHWEIADETSCLAQSQCTGARPTSSNGDPIMPGRGATRVPLLTLSPQ